MSSRGLCPGPWGSDLVLALGGQVLVLVLGGQVLVLVLVLGGQVLVNIPERNYARSHDHEYKLARGSTGVWV